MMRFVVVAIAAGLLVSCSAGSPKAGSWGQPIFSSRGLVPMADVSVVTSKDQRLQASLPQGWSFIENDALRESSQQIEPLALEVGIGNPEAGIACGIVARHLPPSPNPEKYLPELRAALAQSSMTKEKIVEATEASGAKWRSDFYFRKTEDFDNGTRLKRLFEFKWAAKDAGGVHKGFQFNDFSFDRLINVTCNTQGKELDASRIAYLISSHVRLMPPEPDSGF